MQFLLGGAVGVAIALKYTKGWWKSASPHTTLLISAAALLGDQLWMGRSVVDDHLPEHTALSKQLATSLIALGVPELSFDWIGGISKTTAVANLGIGIVDVLVWSLSSHS